MSTRLYIVRHGQSKWNLESKIQGSTDIELSEEGIKQAYSLAKRLKYEKIDIIYSSNLSRAYKTAEIIAKEFNIKVNILHELREITFGVWEGLTNIEIENLYKEKYHTWKTDPTKVVIENAETLKQLQDRILKGIYPLIEKNKDKNILIISHGTSIKALILGLLGIDLSFYPKIKQDNTAVNIIDIKDDGKPVLILLNDTCHLRER